VQGAEIHAVLQVLLLLLLFVVLFAALARKLQIPYPIVLVVAGLLLSFVPGTPRVALNPEVVFLVVLPLLLFAAAWLTSWRDFKRNLFSILSLAFGLVGFTVLGVAATAHFLFPGFEWRLGCVLGAVIAPTDAIAATAIVKRVGLPQRIVRYPGGREPGQRRQRAAGSEFLSGHGGRGPRIDGVVRCDTAHLSDRSGTGNRAGGRDHRKVDRAAD
jgi:hypothetical protein